jgi:hypothetical protein
MTIIHFTDGIETVVAELSSSGNQDPMHTCHAAIKWEDH